MKEAYRDTLDNGRVVYYNRDTANPSNGGYIQAEAWTDGQWFAVREFQGITSFLISGSAGTQAEGEDKARAHLESKGWTLLESELEAERRKSLREAS